MPDHIHGQHQVIRNIHTNIKQGDQAHATKKCKRDIPLWIFDFFCNGCDVSPTMVGPQDRKESTEEMAKTKFVLPRPPRLQIFKIRFGLCSAHREKINGDKRDKCQGNNFDNSQNNLKRPAKPGTANVHARKTDKHTNSNCQLAPERN